MTESLQVEPTEAADRGPCECCGSLTRVTWGFVHGSASSEVPYFVQWTLGRVTDHGALFDLILTQPGDDAAPPGRVLVTLDYRLTETGPGFMVIDAAGRPAADSDLVDRALARSEVVGQPVAAEAFAVADAILEQDPRVAELLGEHSMVSAGRKAWWRFWR